MCTMSCALVARNKVFSINRDQAQQISVGLAGIGAVLRLHALLIKLLARFGQRYLINI